MENGVVSSNYNFFHYIKFNVGLVMLWKMYLFVSDSIIKKYFGQLLSSRTYFIECYKYGGIWLYDCEKKNGYGNIMCKSIKLNFIKRFKLIIYMLRSYIMDYINEN